MAENDYENLVAFWNQSFQVKSEDKERLIKEIDPNEDYKDLAPSKKQYDALLELISKENVLDYGCGSGWASVVMAKNGCKHIDAVDVASNSIEMMNCYLEAFGVSDKVTGINIDSTWLKNQKEAVYDGSGCRDDVEPLHPV